MISDTIGFIQDLPPSLIQAFKSTLEEAIQADILIHVFDASESQKEQNRKNATVKEILHDLSIVTHTLSARSEAMGRSVSSAAKALENLAGLTDKLTQQVPDLLEHANQTAQTLKGMSEEVARTSTAVSAAADR